MATSQSASEQRNIQSSGGISNNRSGKGSIGGVHSASGPIKQQNVVIDIESEDLTYNQARSIRLQLQRDVEQLRNRVRMLRQEVTRANKKITETKTKTQQMQKLQIQNDEQVIRKLEEQQKNEEKRK